MLLQVICFALTRIIHETRVLSGQGAEDHGEKEFAYREFDLGCEFSQKGALKAESSVREFIFGQPCNLSST